MPALIWAACFATALEPDDLEEEDLEEELLEDGFRGALDTDVLKPSSLKLRPRSSPNSLMVTFPVALSIETISMPSFFSPAANCRYFGGSAAFFLVSISASAARSTPSCR